MGNGTGARNSLGLGFGELKSTSVGGDAQDFAATGCVLLYQG